MPQNYRTNTKNYFRLSGYIFIISIFVFGVFIFNGIVHATEVENIQAKINATNSDIQRLIAEIKIAEQSLNKTVGQATTLKNTLAALKLSKKKLEAELKKTTLNLNKTTTIINGLVGDITEAEKSIEEKKVSIAHSLRDIHNEEDTSLIETFLSSKNLTDVSAYVDGLDKLNLAIEHMISELKETEIALSEKKSEQEERKTELNKLKKNLSGQQKAVLDTTKETNKLLIDTKNQQSIFQKNLDEKVRLRAQFEQDLFKYESELKIAIDPRKLPTAIRAGVLEWPLTNISITQFFGKTSFSGRLYVSGTHNGTDFRATDGTKVMAVFSGTVTAIGNTDLKKSCYSYGKWILIKHPNGLSSLYAHLSSQSVRAGESVSKGDIIGYSGRTGYVTGPHLHLTILATEGIKGVLPIPTATPCNGVIIPLAATEAFLDPMLYLPPVPRT